MGQQRGSIGTTLALFGCHFARLHPSLVARVAGVDIGDAGSAEHRGGMTPRRGFGVLGYQPWLAAAWRIDGGLAAKRWGSKPGTG